MDVDAVLEHLTYDIVWYKGHNWESWLKTMLSPIMLHLPHVNGQMVAIWNDSWLNHISTCITCIHIFGYNNKLLKLKINKHFLIARQKKVAGLYCIFKQFLLQLWATLNADFLWKNLWKGPLDDIIWLIWRHKTQTDTGKWKRKVTSCERPVFAMFVAIHQLDKSYSKCLGRKTRFLSLK